MYQYPPKTRVITALGLCLLGALLRGPTAHAQNSSNDPLYMTADTTVYIPTDAAGSIPTLAIGFGRVVEPGLHFGFSSMLATGSLDRADPYEMVSSLVELRSYAIPDANLSFFFGARAGFSWTPRSDVDNQLAPHTEILAGARLVNRGSGGTLVSLEPGFGFIPDLFYGGDILGAVAVSSQLALRIVRPAK